ncbi:MAG: hypothetical protein DRQ10_07355 [Candidatus Hydrothermota bacterium]|nr:MAG: hypothetical protein DRQ10_07355 [Candidatus Hydrothermae bacterium]
MNSDKRAKIDMERFSEFIKNIELKSISLKELKVLSLIPFEGKLPKVKIKFSSDEIRIIEGVGFEVIQKLKLEGRHSRKLAIKIELTQSIFYKLKNQELLIENFVEHFAQSSSILHGWPYIRETISYTVVKMGYPPLFLPLLPLPDSQADTVER